jgi:hypothetical protein
MLDEALKEALASVPNCVAVGAVDLRSGTLLAMQAQEPRSQEVLNLMTQAITELFEAPLLQAFADIYAGSHDRSGAQTGNPFTELLLLNDAHSYLLMRGREKPHLALLMIALKETPVGLLILRTRALLPQIEQRA